jgi:hypothetical protein
MRFWVPLASLALLLVSSGADAQDDPLRLMREPGSFTDVIDAADELDPYDLNVRLGFRRSKERATLQRQSTGTVPSFVDVADWERTRNVLELGLDFGIYRDVALFARMPLVLVDNRALTPVDGAGPVMAYPGDADVPLFQLPFSSPDRSGLEHLAVGLAFSPMNQGRHRWQPTWTMLLEGRFSVGELIEPCAAGTDCGDGVSDGTHAIRFENRLSRRFRYVELYGGLGFHFAWAGRAEDRFAPGGRLSGYVHRRPPMRGFLTAGVEIIPWEERMKWQRLSFDLRATGTYVSEGRDYSQLYDALGTSQHRLLTTPNYEGIQPTMGPTYDLEAVPFNGLTDVQAHGELSGTVAVEMQAAKYVRFRFSTTLTYVSPHFVTFSDACNTSADPESADDPRIGGIVEAGTGERVGGCNDGIIDPHYRAIIDAPGQRFRIDDVLRTTFFVHATVQF